MVASKSPEVYPAIYQDLVTAVTETGQAVEVAMQDHSSAVALRHKFYSWRAAIRDNTVFSDTYARAAAIKVQIIQPTADAWSVRFSSTDLSSETAAIEAAIAKVRG